MLILLNSHPQIRFFIMCTFGYSLSNGTFNTIQGILALGFVFYSNPKLCKNLGHLLLITYPISSIFL